jgi:uncharacterized membrane protein YfcA
VSPDSPLIVALAALVAGAIAAISGFGIGSILTPLLLLSFPAPAAVALVAIPHMIATAVRWWGLRAHVDGPTFRQFGVASAVGGLTGAVLQPHFGGVALTLVLAALLLLAGSTQVAMKRVPIPPTPFWRLAGGALSGLFGGLVGNQGGIRAAALLGFELRPTALVATGTAAALLVDAARLPVYLVVSHQALTAQVPLVIAASAGAMAGTFVGVPVLRHIPERLYRRLIGAMLLALGLGLIAGVLARGTSR